MLEQLARDVTGWHARAVEFFQLLGDDAVHEPPAPRQPLRAGPAPLGAARRASAAPFESIAAHASTCGASRAAAAATTSPTSASSCGGCGAYRAHALPRRARRRPALARSARSATTLPLFTSPMTEDEITHLAEPLNVPDPISRRVLARARALYYGTRAGAVGRRQRRSEHRAVRRRRRGPRSDVVVCDLSDDGAAWAHVPPTGSYAIDPVLGRIALAADRAVPAERARRPSTTASAPTSAAASTTRARPLDAAGDRRACACPDDHPTIQAALARARRRRRRRDHRQRPLRGDARRSRSQADGHVVSARRRAVPAHARARRRARRSPAAPNSAFTLDGLLVAGDR